MVKKLLDGDPSDNTHVSQAAASDFWRSRFAFDWGSWLPFKKKDEPDYANILRTVWRTANVLRNAEEGDERQLNVAWAKKDDSSINRCRDNNVYLSASVVDRESTLKPDWQQGQLTDVLVGESLSESTLKRTIDAETEDKLIESAKGGVREDFVHRVWYTLERVAAETEVVRDYPGFQPYMTASRAYYTDPSAKAEVETRLSNNDPTSLVAAFQWSLLHVDDALRMRDDQKLLIDECCSIASAATSSPQRATAAEEIIRRLLPKPPKRKLAEDFAPSSRLAGKMPTEALRIGMPTPRRGTPVEGTNASDGADIDLRLAHGDDSTEESMCRPPDGSKDVTVRPPTDYSRYERIVARLRPRIEALRSRLKIRNEERRILEHGLRRGRLDEGSVYKLGFADCNETTLFEQEEIAAPPDVAIMILVDESGSMGCHNRWEAARDMTTVIVNALKPIRGVDVAVLGHSGQGTAHGVPCRGMSLHHYFTPKNSNISSLVRISAFSQNLDGYAIAACAKYMRQWYPNHCIRVLIHVSDGLPEADGYHGPAAVHHVGSVCRWARQLGVEVVGIGVEKAFSEDKGREMYGVGNFVITDTIDESVAAVGNLIVKACRLSCSAA